MDFDATVTLGNLLTIFTLITLAIAGFVRIDLKLGVHDTWIQDHAECNRKQIQILMEVRQELSFIKGRLETVNRKTINRE
jgi:hypothetical protein